MSAELSDVLELVRHTVASTAHIVIDPAACATCQARPCLVACPAECFTLEDDQVKFGYEGCLECGTCRVVCPLGSVNWNNPPGGLGVTYRIG